MMKVFIVVLCLCVALCDGSRSCLSCSAVEGSTACSHHITCTDNEVCYTHRYVTESGKEYFDFGCSLEHVCPAPVNAFVGRRAEGRHTMCFECCNDTNFCNQNVPCSAPTTASAANLPKECSDIKPIISTSGVYTIYPFGIQERPVKVHCIVEASTNSRIWTVIQQRANGSVNFYRDWNSYKQGFGSPYGNYWLGNDVIHALTSSENHELMINMSDFDADKKYAEYRLFHVGDESGGYMIHVSDYTGNAGDSLSYHSGSKFSTYDRNNDRVSRNCASEKKGAWWFHNCAYSDLNGEYLYGRHQHVEKGVYWRGFKGSLYSLRSTLMMIKKRRSK